MKIPSPRFSTAGSHETSRANGAISTHTSNSPSTAGLLASNRVKPTWAYQGWLPPGPRDSARDFRTDVAALGLLATKQNPDLNELKANLSRVAIAADSFPENAPEAHFALGTGYVRLASFRGGNRIAQALQEPLASLGCGRRRHGVPRLIRIVVLRDEPKAHSLRRRRTLGNDHPVHHRSKLHHDPTLPCAWGYSTTAAQIFRPSPRWGKGIPTVSRRGGLR